jgi:hypothetical protein
MVAASSNDPRRVMPGVSTQSRIAVVTRLQ